MKRSPFVFVTALCTLSVSYGQRPNMVFILANDLGIGDVKCYGGERCKVDTPNIDKLAATGIRFTDAHPNASVCVPTPVAIMTGRYPCPAGATCDRMVGLNDLFATLAEVAGHELPRGAALDSISFLSLLQNPKGKATRTNLMMQSVGPMVVRENNWKLCLCPGSGSNGPFAYEPKAEPAWKKGLAAYGKKPRNHDELLQPPFVQLYDLDVDPGEKNNLATDHPDTVKRLVGLLREQIANGRSTPGPKLTNGKDKIHPMQRVPPFVWKKK